jgi:hypothetical protein
VPVFAPTATLALYYLGVSYLAVLAWAGVGHDLIHDRSDDVHRRTQRRVVGLVVFGVAHPAFALAAWDIARELAKDGDGPPASAVRQVALAVAAASAAAGVALHLVRAS